MTDAASVVVDVLREHVSAGGHVDHMTGVVSVKCKACQEWIPDSGEYHGGFKAHVAAAVVDALGGLERETQFKYTHLGTGRWTILESTDVQVARKIAGTTHELAEVTRWVSNWAEVTPDA